MGQWIYIYILYYIKNADNADARKYRIPAGAAGTNQQNNPNPNKIDGEQNTNKLK